MKQYVGLDVSMEETKVCVLDGAGVVVFEGSVASRPAALAKLLNAKAPHAERIALETGSLSSWLWHELKAAGFPVVCLDARHAKAALSMRINKTDRNDARGLAELIRMGWYREAKVKSMESRQIRALLAARSKLVDLRRDLENQMRGLLKSLGLIIGKSGVRVLPNRITALLRDAPHLRLLIDPLMTAHSTLAEQIATYDLQVRELAKTDQTIGRLMTVPGVGPVTALAFASTVDDPQRFARATDVGAYLGLTPRRYQSGELDRNGRISKRGRSADALLSVRGCQRAHQCGSPHIAAEGLGYQAGQTHRTQEDHGRRGPQARCHPALHLDRRHRVQLGWGSRMNH
jgi:transposase